MLKKAPSSGGKMLQNLLRLVVAIIVGFMTGRNVGQGDYLSAILWAVPALILLTVLVLKIIKPRWFKERAG